MPQHITSVLGHQSTSPPVIHLTLIHHEGAPLMEQRAPSHGTANNPHMERRAPARRATKSQPSLTNLLTKP